MAENQEKKEILDSLRGRVTSDQAEKVAFTIQTTIELLEKTDPKSLKLKELKDLKKKLIGLGKSILEARTLENKNSSLVGKQMLGGTIIDGLTRKEREKIDSVQREIDKIVKKLGILLESKVDTSALKKEIEKKKEIIDYLKANLEFLPKNKQKLNLSLLPIEELEALKNDFAGKVEVLKVIKAGADFLPFSERVFDLASTSIAKLNELVAKIEANKKTFEKFKAIDVFSSLAEKSLFVYFYKYLENKSKPAIETLVKVFNDVKEKAEEYKLAQEKVFAETKKITEIEARIAKKQGQRFEMPSFETMSTLMKERDDSMLKADFLEIFAKLLNDPATEIKKYLSSFDEAIEGQKTSLVRLTMNEVAVVGQELLVDGYIDLDKLSTSYSAECRVAEEFPGRDNSRLKALGEQLKAKQAALLATNIGLLTKVIANLKFDEWLLGKTYNKMVKLASSPEEKRNLFVEFESTKAGIKTRIDSFLDQITDISFALKTTKEEETFRTELASGKELSPGSKAFAKRKADFLGKKLKRLDEDFAIADSNNDIKKLGVIEDQKTALSFEKKVLEGKFSFEESLDIYWKLRATNPGLAENIKFYLESLGLKEMQKTIFNDVDKGAVKFENDFAFHFGGFPGKAIMNGTINVEYLNSVRPIAENLIGILESNGYFLTDLKKARTSIDKVLKKLEGVGLKDSALYVSLTRASELYLNLERRYVSTNDSDTYKFLSFVVNDAVPETDMFKPETWKYPLETFVKIIVPIVVGATIAAVLVIALGPASIPAYILGAAGGAVGQEAFKPLVGLESDFSPGNLAINFATSAASSFAFVKGAGALFKSLSKAAKLGRLGRVGRTVLKLAGKAANPASLRSPVVNLAHRLVSEPFEEVEEEASQQIHPALGALASFMNSSDGVNLDTSNLSIEAARVVSAFKTSDATFLTSTDTSAILEFSAGKTDALLAHLKTLDGKISTKTNGSIVFAFKARLSSTNEVTLEFRPSSESSSVRNLMSSDVGLALQTDFGMVPGQDGSYVYGKGKSKALKNGLENNGFVVQVAGDVVIAQKGDMQLTFNPKSLISGTNTTTMENTRLRTIEAAEPERIAGIKIGSTMGSQVVGLLRADVADLWAGMKTSLSEPKVPDAMAKADARIAAQVKTALDNRGLPADFLAGISPAEQLQVLSDVATMQAESDATGLSVTEAVESGEMEFVPWEAQTSEERQMTENVLPEQRLKLLNPSTPDAFMSVLENNTDGLGAYRFALLIAGQKVMPSFSYSQVLKISEADQGLAEVVVEGMLRSDPAKFNTMRQAFYQDLFAKFGGKEKLEGLAKDVYENSSPDSFDRIASGLKKIRLSPTSLGLLLGVGIALSSGEAMAGWPITNHIPVVGESLSSWWDFGIILLLVSAVSQVPGVKPLAGGLWKIVVKGFGGGGKKVLDWRRAGTEARGRVDATRDALNPFAGSITSLTNFVNGTRSPNRDAINTLVGGSRLHPPIPPDAELGSGLNTLVALHASLTSLVDRIAGGEPIVLPDSVTVAGLAPLRANILRISAADTANDVNQLGIELKALDAFAKTAAGTALIAGLNGATPLPDATGVDRARVVRTAAIVIAIAAALGVATAALWPEDKKENTLSPGDANSAKAAEEEDEKTAAQDAEHAENSLKAASPQIPSDDGYNEVKDDLPDPSLRVAGNEYITIANGLINKLSAKGMTDDVRKLKEAIHRLKVLKYQEKDSSIETSDDRATDIEDAVEQLKALVNDCELKLSLSDTTPVSSKKEEAEVKGEQLDGNAGKDNGSNPDTKIEVKSGTNKAMEAARKKRRR
jgi:hypothetical protein